MDKSIFIISGEESGDKHGAALLAALKRRLPSLKVRGMGGAAMRAEGLQGLDSREISVVGLTEVFEKSPKIIKAFRGLKASLSKDKPDALILIDYPDFNLRFAREAKKRKVPIVYYISPQVWAWRKGRVKTIASLVDKMLVIFPFEEAIYREAGVDVEYVGHPLVDMVRCALTKAEALRLFGAEPGVTVVSILPGSRDSEVCRLLPQMLKAASLMKKELKGAVKFLLPAADSLKDSLFDGFLKASPVRAEVVRGKLYEALRASDAAVVTSGTVTLETALIGTPMVIAYKVSPLTYTIAKLMVSAEYIGLPNIIAGRTVVDELIQDKASPENISKSALDILRDPKRRNDIIKGYEEVRTRLGAGGAAEKAADAVFKIIMGPAARVTV